MRYHPVNTPECKADYRGSIVNLTPATNYDIALTIEGTDLRTECRGATWSENFPVATTVKVSDRDTTLIVDRSGSPDAYVLFDGTGCTIDTANNAKNGIEVKGSYVILRGFTIRNVTDNAIRIFSGHNIVIEGCDISRWGSRDETGFGKNYQAGVFSNNKDIHSVIIQRCRIHHPSSDSNSWAEKNKTYHPEGPQCVVFWNSQGNHVIRYNEFFSDEDHYYNDILGAGSNGSYRGFPGADSDIYCNYIADCWDDGIEVEGNGRNIRIWNNYIEHTLMAIGNAAISVGPLYIWRNVSGSSFSPPGSQWDMTHGMFLKMGYAGSADWMSGTQYIFNNTIFQEDNKGCNGLGGDGRIIRHCTTRNNILHVRRENRRSIAVSSEHKGNDFDYDLVSAAFPPDHEKHGLKDKPSYVQGAGFDFETKKGMFQLAPASMGIDAAEVIPNFCEPVNENHPDIGAHEGGTAKMQFGVKAEFIPVSPAN
ncbi:MAG: right-handed parallel beta-helix repeat-containing protein [Planctomycetota bacterium]|jgi:hypothetical protein